VEISADSKNKLPHSIDMRFSLFKLLLSATIILLVASCSPQEKKHASQQYIQSMRKVPALAWLQANTNQSALATNRFGPTKEARKFVEHLFRLGAVQVYVGDPMDEATRINDEGGPYADTLIVELPDNAEVRAKLFQVFADEAKREAFDPEPDTGQRQVLLWWD